MQVKGTERKFGLIFFLNKEKKFIINGLLGRLFVCVEFRKILRDSNYGFADPWEERFKTGTIKLLFCRSF